MPGLHLIVAWRVVATLGARDAGSAGLALGSPKGLAESERSGTVDGNLGANRMPAFRGPIRRLGVCAALALALAPAGAAHSRALPWWQKPVRHHGHPTHTAVSAAPAKNKQPSGVAPNATALPPVALAAQAPLVPTPAPPARASAYKPVCDPAPSREDAEYCQAAKAAEAASQSARWALGQFVVGVLGVIAVVLTLWFTKRAAEAAAKAARVAEKALLDLERPYVFVHGMQGVEALPQDEYKPRIVYNVSNNGKLAARIDTVSIACGPGNNGSFPPLRLQDRHRLLERPILSADEQRSRIFHELLGENFISRGDLNGSSGIAYNVDDGVIFQVLIEYRGPSGQSHETGQVWKYDSEVGGWCELADPHHTYMT